jgi:hypothetical protein
MSGGGAARRQRVPPGAARQALQVSRATLPRRRSLGQRVDTAPADGDE